MLALRQVGLAAAVVMLLGGASHALGARAPILPRYISAVQVDPKRPTVVYAAAVHTGVLKSTDAGKTWNATNRGLTPPPGSPPAIRVDALALDSRSPSVLYAGTGLGVFKSSDGAKTWRRASAGIDFRDDPLEHRLAEGFIWAIAVHGSTVYAAGGSRSAGGIWKTTNGGATWRRVLRSSVVNVAIDPLRLETVYASGISEGRSEPTTTSIYKTVDGGSTWRASGPPDLGDPYFGHPILVDRQRAGSIYAGGSRGLFASANEGRTWRRLLALRNAFSGVNAIALDPVRANVLYVGTATRGVVKSVDGGQTWSTPSTPRLGSVGRGVTAIAIARTRPQTIYAGVYGQGQGGMFASTDGGATWHRLL
jgi:photosystem II stability/assembly factor-like uncharacterized protein